MAMMRVGSCGGWRFGLAVGLAGVRGVATERSRMSALGVQVLEASGAKARGGHVEEARGLLEHGAALCARSVGEFHPDTVRVCVERARLGWALGRGEEAAEALEALRSAGGGWGAAALAEGGGAAAGALLAHEALAHVLLMEGRSDEALALAREVVDGCGDRPGLLAVRAHGLHGLLSHAAHSHGALGNHEWMAEQAFTRCVEAWRAAHGAEAEAEAEAAGEEEGGGPEGDLYAAACVADAAVFHAGKAGGAEAAAQTWVPLLRDAAGVAQGALGGGQGAGTMPPSPSGDPEATAAAVLALTAQATAQLGGAQRDLDDEEALLGRCLASVTGEARGGSPEQPPGRVAAALGLVGVHHDGPRESPVVGEGLLRSALKAARTRDAFSDGLVRAWACARLADLLDRRYDTRATEADALRAEAAEHWPEGDGSRFGANALLHVRVPWPLLPSTGAGWWC